MFKVVVVPAYTYVRHILNTVVNRSLSYANSIEHVQMNIMQL